MTDWTQPEAYEKPRKARKRGGWLEAAVLIIAFCAGLA